jgi:D-alanine-D-alanine ligase
VAGYQAKSFPSMKILVLGGGDSPEREVSLQSAANIAESASAAGFEVELADPSEGLDVLDNLPNDTLVFPILHGAGGEDGAIQAELQKRGLAYLGSDSKASALCWDKWQVWQKLRSNGLIVPKSELVTKDNIKQSDLFNAPYVLKVIHGGSSIGVLITREPKKVSDSQVAEIFEMETPSILQELIEGIEITVSVLDQASLPVVEIHPPIGEEFDYQNKYNGKSQEICPPQNVSKSVQTAAQKLALSVHMILGCRHLSRTDMIVRPNDDIVVIDVNTIPGLAKVSLYPKAAAAARLTMPHLVKRFVDMVKRDYSI